MSEEAGGRMAATYTVASVKAPPPFSENIPYSRYINELKCWDKISKLESKEKGLAVALSLPQDSDIRDKVFSEMTPDDLNVEDGLTKLITFLDGIYKKEEIATVYEAWSKFDKLCRKSGETMEHYLREFDKCSKRIKKEGIDMPDPVLAFQLLDYSGLSAKEKQIVLTGVDYTKKNKVYEQMVSSIKKFFGDQMITGETNKSENHAITFKEEPVMVTKSEFKQKRFPQDSRYESKNQYSERKQRLNPINSYTGKPYRCYSCRSEFHFLRDCPVKEKNQAKRAYEVEASLPTEDKE